MESGGVVGVIGCEGAEGGDVICGGTASTGSGPAGVNVPDGGALPVAVVGCGAARTGALATCCAVMRVSVCLLTLNTSRTRTSSATSAATSARVARREIGVLTIDPARLVGG